MKGPGAPGRIGYQGEHGESEKEWRGFGVSRFVKM